MVYVDPYDITSSLDTIALLPLEVETVLKSLVTGNASGPNGLGNRILKELSKELANLFGHYSATRCQGNATLFLQRSQYMSYSQEG